MNATRRAWVGWTDKGSNPKSWSKSQESCRLTLKNEGQVLPTIIVCFYLFGHKAQFAFRGFLKIRRFIYVHTKIYRDRDRASIPNPSSSQPSGPILTPCTGFLPMLTLVDCLCLWHALLITMVNETKRSFENSSAAPNIATTFFSKDRFASFTNVISEINWRGAVESVLL